MSEPGIKFGGFDDRTVHLCIDMQRMFAEETDWHTPWLRRMLPQIIRLTEPRPTQTVFTRFIPEHNAQSAQGSWRRVYEKYPSMTREKLDPGMVDLVPELSCFTPQAITCDKHLYSPWFDTDLHIYLQEQKVETLVISGGETEICVLSTVQGAVDLGYRVVVAKDALWSSADETHDAIISLYHSRYSLQIEAASVDEILASWK